MIKEKVTINYSKDTKWSKPESCKWECEAGFILENDKCINSKQVECKEGIKPESTNYVKKNVKINYTNGVWSEPKECDWECDENHVLSDDKKSCINQKEANCTEVVTPKNATQNRIRVTVNYKSGKGWSTPNTCKWSCNEGYILENGFCINSKQVTCNSVEYPENASLNKKNVTINYINNSWETPKNCEWQCNFNYTLNEDKTQCINRKKVSCETIKPPKNAKQIDKEITVKYTTGGGWEKAPVCSWECDEDYVSENGFTCIHSKTTLCQFAKFPKNSHLVPQNVEITYSSETKKWSKPEECNWECDKNYYSDDGKTCINAKMAMCSDIPHPENSHLVEKLYLSIYNSKLGWSKTKDCTWECDKDYISEDGKTCIHEKQVDCASITPPESANQINIKVPIYYTTNVGWSKPQNCSWECLSNYNTFENNCFPFDVKISSGGSHTCILKYDGTVNCFGDNQYGQLGDGTNTNKSIQTKVKNINNAVQVATGGSHTCILTKDKEVYCFGDNQYGQLGNGTNKNQAIPVKVLNSSNIIKVTTGSKHTCLLFNNGQVGCFGRNYDGQVGEENKIDQNKLFMIENLKNVVDLVSGGFHNIALLKDKTAVSWGYNLYGQLGDGTLTTRTTPTKVQKLENIKTIKSGDFHNCLILEDNSIFCFGLNDFGQLGNGEIINYSEPKKTKLDNIKFLTLGSKHSMVINEKDELLFFGREYKDVENIKKIKTAEKIDIVKNVTDISAGSKHICFTFKNGKSSCFGNNNYGQLGTGDKTDKDKIQPIQEAR